MSFPCLFRAYLERGGWRKLSGPADIFKFQFVSQHVGILDSFARTVFNCTLGLRTYPLKLLASMSVELGSIFIDADTPYFANRSLNSSDAIDLYMSCT
jgi:hypothetical protein